MKTLLIILIAVSPVWGQDTTRIYLFHYYELHYKIDLSESLQNNYDLECIWKFIDGNFYRICEPDTITVCDTIRYQYISYLGGIKEWRKPDIVCYNGRKVISDTRIPPTFDTITVCDTTRHLDTVLNIEPKWELEIRWMLRIENCHDSIIAKGKQ